MAPAVRLQVEGSRMLLDPDIALQEVKRVASERLNCEAEDVVLRVRDPDAEAAASSGAHGSGGLSEDDMWEIEGEAVFRDAAANKQMIFASKRSGSRKRRMSASSHTSNDRDALRQSRKAQKQRAAPTRPASNASQRPASRQPPLTPSRRSSSDRRIRATSDTSAGSASGAEQKSSRKAWQHTDLQKLWESFLKLAKDMPSLHKFSTYSIGERHELVERVMAKNARICEGRTVSAIDTQLRARVRAERERGVRLSNKVEALYPVSRRAREEQGLPLRLEDVNAAATSSRVTVDALRAHDRAQQSALARGAAPLASLAGRRRNGQDASGQYYADTGATLRAVSGTTPEPESDPATSPVRPSVTLRSQGSDGGQSSVNATSTSQRDAARNLSPSRRTEHSVRPSNNAAQSSGPSHDGALPQRNGNMTSSSSSSLPAPPSAEQVQERFTIKRSDSNSSAGSAHHQGRTSAPGPADVSTAQIVQPARDGYIDSQAPQQDQLSGVPVVKQSISSPEGDEVENGAAQSASRPSVRELAESTISRGDNGQYSTQDGLPVAAWAVDFRSQLEEHGYWRDDDFTRNSRSLFFSLLSVFWRRIMQHVNSLPMSVHQKAAVAAQLFDQLAFGMFPLENRDRFACHLAGFTHHFIFSEKTKNALNFFTLFVGACVHLLPTPGYSSFFECFFDNEWGAELRIKPPVQARTNGEASNQRILHPRTSEHVFQRMLLLMQSASEMRFEIGKSADLVAAAQYCLRQNNDVPRLRHRAFERFFVEANCEEPHRWAQPRLFEQVHHAMLQWNRVCGTFDAHPPQSEKHLEKQNQQNRPSSDSRHLRLPAGAVPLGAQAPAHEASAGDVPIEALPRTRETDPSLFFTPNDSQMSNSAGTQA